MDNFIDLREIGNKGTVADFSNWTGIKTEGNFRNMKTVIKEKIHEEQDEFEQNDTDASTLNLENVAKQKNFNERSAVEEGFVKPNELKSIAVRLLPTVDKINKEDYLELSEKAIDFAFAFLKVWDNKVELS